CDPAFAFNSRLSRRNATVMPQPPLPPGEPATAMREAAEILALRAGDPLSPPRSSPRRLPPVWQKIAWVGFAAEREATPALLDGESLRPAAPPAMPQASAPASTADAVPGQALLRADPADAWADLSGSRAVPSRPSSTV